MNVNPRLRWPSLAAAALAVALAGCAPEPAVEPTTGFANEAEAFAAAEETYRAYVDALNAHRADPTAPDPQTFLMGDALKVDLETQRQLESSELRVVGQTRVVKVAAAADATDLAKIEIEVCLDSSETRVLDASERDVTPMDRATRSLLRVTMIPVGDDARIVESETAVAQTC